MLYSSRTDPNMAKVDGAADLIPSLKRICHMYYIYKCIHHYDILYTLYYICHTGRSICPQTAAGCLMAVKWTPPYSRA